MHVGVEGALSITSCVPASGPTLPPSHHVLLLGDNQAGLHLLYLGGPSGATVQPINVPGALSPARVLCALPPLLTPKGPMHQVRDMYGASKAQRTDIHQ